MASSGVVCGNGTAIRRPAPEAKAKRPENGGKLPLRKQGIQVSMIRKRREQVADMPSPPRKATQTEKTAPVRRFVFLLLDRFTMLAFASAIEPLRIANRVAGRTVYTWALAGENGQNAVCSNGTSFHLDMGLEE